MRFDAGHRGTPLSLKRIRNTVLVVALSAVGLWVLAAVGSRLLDRVILGVDFDPMPFDAAVWKATPSEFSLDSVRLRMVDDFLTRPVVGWSRERIEAELGKPDDTPYFRAYQMVYHLGQERHPFGLDSEWLVFSLGDNDIVTACRVLTD